MTDEEEDAYLYAQDRTRMRIAIDVLKEVIHGDFQVTRIINDLYRQVDTAYEKRENPTNKSDTDEGQ